MHHFRLLGWLWGVAFLGSVCLPAPEACASETKPVHAFNEASIIGAALSPSEKVLATWGERLDSQPGRIILWDLTSGKERHALAGHAGNVWAAVFSPDGTHFAASTRVGNNDTTFVWVVKSGRLLAKFNGTSNIYSVAFSPDGKILATGGYDGNDGTVRVWNLEAKQEIAAHKCDEAINTVAFSPDGQTLVAGLKDGTIWVSGEGGKQKGRQLAAHSKKVSAVAFSPDGKVLTSGGHDGTFIVWQTADWKPTKPVQTSLLRVFSLTFSRDGKTLAVGGDLPFQPGTPPEKVVLGFVEFYCADKFEKVATLRPHVAPVLSVSFSSDGKLFATAGIDGFGPTTSSAKVWKVEELLPRRERK